jgi:hypothetical protein
MPSCKFFGQNAVSTMDTLDINGLQGIFALADTMGTLDLWPATSWLFGYGV